MPSCPLAVCGTLDLSCGSWYLMTGTGLRRCRPLGLFCFWRMLTGVTQLGWDPLHAVPTGLRLVCAS